MGISGGLLIVKQTLTTSLFKLVRLVFVTVQQIVWRFNGTARLVDEARRPENYGRSAQILDIVTHYHFDILHTFAFENFICTHNRFESPSYILENDHISLLTVNDRDAIFVEAKKQDMLHWKSEHSPYIRNGQLENSRRLIVVPLSVFHRMSEELGDPKGQLIFLFNAGQSGSTLLSHMMEYTGVCVAISEPDAPNILATRYRRRGDSKELREVTQDTIRFLCRPYKSVQQPVAYVLTISSISAYAAPLFTGIFPDSRCLYVYRDPVKMAQSVCRATRYMPSFALVYILGKYSARFTEMAFNLIGFAGIDYHIKLNDDFTVGIYLTIQTAMQYLELRRRGFPAVAVRCEDVIANPLFVCQEMLKFCGVPASLAPAAIEALKIDCQRNTPVSRDLLSRHKCPILTPESKTSANELFQKFGLPLIGEEPWLLEGTIGRK